MDRTGFFIPVVYSAPMRPSLIALDIDGTLTTSGAPVPSTLAPILSDYTRQGGQVCLISGRNPQGMVQAARALQLADGTWLAGADGGVLSRTCPQGHTVVQENPAPLEVLWPLLAEERLPGQIMTGTSVLLVGSAHPHLERLAALTDPHLIKVSSWEEVPDLLGEDVPVGVRFLAEIEQEEVVDAMVARLAPNQVEKYISAEFLPGLVGLAVRPAGWDKAQALRWIAAQCGCRVEDSLALGDWVTDIPMLREAGDSLAPADAFPVVRSAAHRVSPYAIHEQWAERELTQLLG